MILAKYGFRVLSIDERVSAIAIKGNQVNQPMAEDIRTYLLNVHKKVVSWLPVAKM